MSITEEKLRAVTARELYEDFLDDDPNADFAGIVDALEDGETLGQMLLRLGGLNEEVIEELHQLLTSNLRAIVGSDWGGPDSIELRMSADQLFSLSLNGILSGCSNDL
jgi:hypothetical protein